MDTAKEHALLLELIARAAVAPLGEHDLAELNARNVGFDRTLGLRYTRVGADGVTCELDVTEAHLQPAGIVNGGVYAALAESAASLAGMVAAGAPVVGVTNSTDFIAATGSGTLRAVATPVQLGRRTQLWSVEVTRNGKLLSRTTLRTMPART
ncbi:PaaI family thioesterase [Corynebacterium uterequi]|uniref:Thioesterase domain-containing protein n=1 Tax=Corynebacterium uterequi TaxID=1072256 RepID=A0A0G3HCE8_9CORY|nr:PaaI family thioesterase [Corynebacterium uterequi]AKK11061.1 hypothetical protein CUTER_05320 [Corynebacterium uterequi]